MRSLESRMAIEPKASYLKVFISTLSNTFLSYPSIATRIIALPITTVVVTYLGIRLSNPYNGLMMLYIP